MKKFVSVFLIFLMLSMTACSNQDAPQATEVQTEVVQLESGVWPVNEYTNGLPVPPGTVEWAMLDTKFENCSINIVDISESEFNDYIETLKNEGFSVIEEVSEEIEGQDYVSIGTILVSEEKGLSVGYIPNSLTIYISFDTDIK